MLKVATSMPLAMLAEPINVAPSKKFTVPAGVPEAELTVALSVTDCPNVEGFKEDANVVVVAAVTLFEV